MKSIELSADSRASKRKCTKGKGAVAVRAYNKVVVYPYNHTFEPVVRHFDQLCISAEEIAVVSPGGLVS